VQFAKDPQENLLSQILVVMSRAQCPAEEAIHHWGESEPNLALSPDLTFDGLPAQDSVVSLGCSAPIRSRIDRPPLGDKQSHAVATPVVSHPIGIRSARICKIGLRSHNGLASSRHWTLFQWGSVSTGGRGSQISQMQNPSRQLLVGCA
jgi:hypothetical protein